MGKAAEIYQEIKFMLAGKTLDAVWPPLVFVFSNLFIQLTWAVGAALGLAAILGARRLFLRQKWHYAAAGLLGVAIAGGFALWTQSAVNYFLPVTAGTALWLTFSLGTIVVKKPLAALASHLTRRWPLEWYWRPDVMPAYIAVTWFWVVFFLLRLVAQVLLYLDGDPLVFALANALSGWPVVVLVLIASYIYGQWRLRRLGGPGVDEFEENASPPWQGQQRGF